MPQVVTNQGPVTLLEQLKRYSLTGANTSSHFIFEKPASLQTKRSVISYDESEVEGIQGACPQIYI
jgi:hypothetical protein